MKNFLIYKNLISRLREYIFIFLTATIFLLFLCSKSFSEENVFIVENVKVEGSIDVNFSRDKYLNKAFSESFTMLMTKVLLSEDLNKIKKIKLKIIKNLINSFQISEESYKNDKYKLTLKVVYNDTKVKKFLENNNISFSQPTKISAIFFPIFFIEDEIQDFNQNFFYKEWNNVEIKNELINFILPLEDLDDISKFRELKKRLEILNVNDFVSKYDVKNYVFALMDYQNKKLSVHLKTNFNNNKMSKNISYDINNIRDSSTLDFILKDLKVKIIDIWKEENVVNLSIPLSIQIKYKYSNLKDLENLKHTFYKIGIIDKFTLEELNINDSFFTIYYYGNPKKLRSELLKFNYKLKNDQVHWAIYKND